MYNAIQRVVKNENLVKKPNFDKPHEMVSDGPKSKGFCGTPLPLLPNIRKTEVEVVSEDKALKLFGMWFTKKVSTIIILYKISLAN